MHLLLQASKVAYKYSSNFTNYMHDTLLLLYRLPKINNTTGRYSRQDSIFIEDYK